MKQVTEQHTWAESTLKQWIEALPIKSEALREQRKQHLKAFSALPWPSRRDEAWRYCRLPQLMKTPFVVDLEPQELEFSLQPSEAFIDIIFVNGVLQEELGSARDLPEGVELTELMQLSSELDEHANAELSGDKMVHLNQALATPGVQLVVRHGVQVPKPIRFLHFYSGREFPTMLHTQHRLCLEHKATASLVQRFCSLDHYEVLVTDVTAVTLNEGATLHYLKSDKMNQQSLHLARTWISQHARSQLNGFSVIQDGRLSRDHVTPVLAGERAQAHWSSLLLGRQSAQVALFCEAKHVAAQARSSQTVKSIARDRARISINGHITVKDQAGQTEAHFQNKNLLLSDQAEINTKPQLIIDTDDVQCSHGATVGQLDEAALFYLQSRGISVQKARQMLIAAFLLDVIEAYPDAVLKEGIYQELELESLSYE